MNMWRSRTIAAVVALAGSGALLVGGAVSSLPDAESKGEITIAVFNGWDEGIAAAELWKHALESEDYTIELVYADPAAVFTGVAGGSYDLVMNGWLPITHASFLETYGDDLVDLGAWNDEAKLTIAVNEDAPIDSLEELAANADLFGNRLVGIEAGAGHTKITADDVIPGYGLGGMDFVTSSTPAMLTELQSATDAGENIAVTLWRPHWAYNAFPVKDLEDPKGLLGEAEGLHTLTSTTFADEFPEVNAWLSDFRMDNDLLYSLQDAMFNQYDGDDYGPVVEDWMAENEDWAGALTR